MRKILIIFLLTLIFAVSGCKDKKSNSLVRIGDESNKYTAVISKLLSGKHQLILGSGSTDSEISTFFVSINNVPLTFEYNSYADWYYGDFDSEEGDTIDVVVKINGVELINTDLVLIHSLDAFYFPYEIQLNSEVTFEWEREENVMQQHFETTKSWRKNSESDWQSKRKCAVLDRESRKYTSDISWIGDGQDEQLSIDFVLCCMNYKRNKGLILASYEGMGTCIRNYEISKVRVKSPYENFLDFKRISRDLD